MNHATEADARSPRYSEDEVREFTSRVHITGVEFASSRSLAVSLKALRSPGKRKPKLLRA